MFYPVCDFRSKLSDVYEDKGGGVRSEFTQLREPGGLSGKGVAMRDKPVNLSDFQSVRL